MFFSLRWNEAIKAAVSRTAFLVLGLGAVCTSASAAQVEVEIDGIDGELLQNAHAMMQLNRYVDRNPSAAQLRLLYEQAPQEIRAALRPYGYYNVEIDSNLEQREPDEFIARFEIELNDPVIVGDVHVSVAGPAADLPEVKAALRAFAPQEGERLVHATYEDSKAAIDQALRAHGFLDAELLESRVAVRRSEHAATIDLQWQSNERHRFGSVEFDDSQFTDTFLRGYVPWQPGDPYSAEQVMHLQQRLVEADYFSLVSVRPVIENLGPRTEIPIEVLLEPDERSLYTAALFVSTDTGLGGRLGAEQRWLNRRGHKAEGYLEYSQRFQEVSFAYRIPQPGRFKRNYSFGAAYEDEETDSSRARTTTIAAAEGRERWHGFTRTLGLHYLSSDFDIADSQRRSELLFTEAALSRRIMDDPLFPKIGYSVTLALRASPGDIASDTNLIQLTAQAQWIRGFDRDDRLLLRGEFGALRTSDFDALPPPLRFFAGGDRSLRGFGYAEIGARNDVNEVIGGEYLATAGVTYERYFLPDWGAAAFVDAGDAFTSDFTLHAGAGLGLRWRSPIGVLRLDFARALAGRGEDDWRIHLVIGPDL